MPQPQNAVVVGTTVAADKWSPATNGQDVRPPSILMSHSRVDLRLPNMVIGLRDFLEAHVVVVLSCVELGSCQG